MLTVLDGCTRECPAIEADSSLAGLRVRRVLDRIVTERGLGEAIVLDNGPEFRRRALAAWSEMNANWFTSLIIGKHQPRTTQR